MYASRLSFSRRFLLPLFFFSFFVTYHTDGIGRYFPFVLYNILEGKSLAARLERALTDLGVNICILGL